MNNFPFTVVENVLPKRYLDPVTVLLLILVGYETERKKTYKAQVDTQLIPNILKQVCIVE